MASLIAARRIVVKIGSSLLVESGDLRTAWLRGLAADIADIRARDADAVIVSSGSIALGRGVLKLRGGALPLEQSQAAAAVGAIRLARAYEEVLSPHGIKTAQILVTLEDSENRRRYLNTRATLEQLLAFGAVPIVNENDTVATDEIRFGDNDRLAAQIAVTVGADALVLLSDVDGFYTADPGGDPAARRLDTIERITAEIEGMAGDTGSGLSKGGMKTKLMAAETATSAGCAMWIAAGAVDRPLSALLDGAPSTVFLPESDPRAARKKWIGSMKPRGEVLLDEGAAGALAAGRSLLPVGVTGVTGDFGRGDPVTVTGPDGTRIGAGLSRYTADEARAIRGLHSAEIEPVLGYPARAALIHRDDLVIQGAGGP